MIESDTIKMLRECDAGIKMGVSSICDVLDHVSDDGMRTCLTRSKDEHEHLQKEVGALLCDCHDDGKDPNPIAKGMAKIKTNFTLAMEESDRKIADVITDGCNMGVKSLSRYLNQYQAADETSKDIAKKLISLEEHLAQQMRAYL